MAFGGAQFVRAAGVIVASKTPVNSMTISSHRSRLFHSQIGYAKSKVSMLPAVEIKVVSDAIGSSIVQKAIIGDYKETTIVDYGSAKKQWAAFRIAPFGVSKCYGSGKGVLSKWSTESSLRVFSIDPITGNCILIDTKTNALTFMDGMIKVDSGGCAHGVKISSGPSAREPVTHNGIPVTHNGNLVYHTP